MEEKNGKAVKQPARVLARKGARELTVKEIEAVAGGLVYHTLVCTAGIPSLTQTGFGDGDGCGDVDSSAY